MTDNKLRPETGAVRHEGKTNYGSQDTDKFSTNRRLWKEKDGRNLPT